MVLSKCMDNDIQNLQRKYLFIKWKDFFPKFTLKERLFFLSYSVFFFCIRSEFYPFPQYIWVIITQNLRSRAGPVSNESMHGEAELPVLSIG